jgi:hypothetical protein
MTVTLFTKGLVKCCHGIDCSPSEGCPQIPILNLFGMAQPTFSKCAEEIRPTFLTFSGFNPTEAAEVGYKATDMELAALPISSHSKVYILIHGFSDKYHESGWLRVSNRQLMQTNPEC